MLNYEITKYRNLIIESDLMINLDKIDYIRYLPNNMVKISTGKDNHCIYNVTPGEFKKFIEDINK